MQFFCKQWKQTADQFRDDDSSYKRKSNYQRKSGISIHDQNTKSIGECKYYTYDQGNTEFFPDDTEKVKNESRRVQFRG